MAIVNARYWECELCGYRWPYNPEVMPDRCRNKECRKRGWNGKGAEAKEPGGNKDHDRAVRGSVAKVDRGDNRRSPIKADVGSLRAIIAGIETGSGEGDQGDQQPVEEPCPYEEYDQDLGEWFGCSLRVHSAKVKHVRGRKL